MKNKKFVELHLHLDGAITVEIAKELANLQNISLPSNDDEELLGMLSVPSDCQSLNDFLKCFKLPLSLMQTEKGIEAAVKLVCDNIKKQGVIYAEIRFAPQLHCEMGLTQEEVIQSALKGLEESNLKSNLILCCMRGADNDNVNEETVNLAVKYLTKNIGNKFGVVALDLAGAEGLYKTEKYTSLFQTVKNKQIPFTIHAGEADGAKSVKKAIELGARRIGHGIRSIEDDEVLNELANKQICLEICPTSNLQTKTINNIKELPIKEFMHLQIPITINTDDMAICRTTLESEVALIRNNFELSQEHEIQMQINAIKFSFADEDTKNELTNEILI